MCCHHKKPREANIMYFLRLPVEAAISNVNVSFFVKNNFWEEINKNK
jgi:hypothetical protein